MKGRWCWKFDGGRGVFSALLWHFSGAGLERHIAMARAGDTMERQEFANVWDALADNPKEAANMTMCSDRLIAIQQKVQTWYVTQTVAAQRLGVT